MKRVVWGPGGALNFSNHKEHINSDQQTVPSLDTLSFMDETKSALPAYTAHGSSTCISQLHSYTISSSNRSEYTKATPSCTFKSLKS